MAARVQYSTWLLVSDALASGAVATSVNLAAGYLQQVCFPSQFNYVRPRIWVYENF